MKRLWKNLITSSRGEYGIYGYRLNLVIKLEIRINVIDLELVYDTQFKEKV